MIALHPDLIDLFSIMGYNGNCGNVFRKLRCVTISPRTYQAW